MKLKAVPTWVRQRKHLFAAFFLPAALLFAAYAAFGVWPFGNESVLVLDLNGQYVFYYEWLKQAIFGDASLLYSWSRNLSGEMLGIVGYYLASPFSIIPVLFPRELVTEGLLVMILAKIGACGLTFGIFLERARSASKRQVVLFALLYALMGYAVVEVMNIMWIDGLVFLPLIALGTERLVREGRFGMFTVSLAVLFISNFYIGYMVAAFTVLYFIYTCVVSGVFGSWKLLLKRALVFAGAALTAGAIAAVILLPVYYSLKLGKFDFSKPDFSLRATFTLFDFLPKLLVDSYDTVRTDGLPFVYCGALTLLLTPLYFLSAQIPAKRKIASAGLLAVLFLSMYLAPLDIAWHGFQVPNWLPYRYSFLLSFVLLILAHEAFRRLGDTPMRTVGKVYIVLMALLVVIDKLGYEYLSTESAIWFTAGAFTIYLLLLYGEKKLPGDASIALVLVMTVGIELFVNTTETFHAIDKDVIYSTRASYLNHIETFQPVVDRVYEEDDGFYRMEKTTHRNVNDPLSLGMYGISHSSSTLNAKSINLLKRMGFLARGHYVKYTGNTPVSDTLLGIKYVLTSDAHTMPDYEDVFTEGYTTAMRNPYALPIVFPSDEALRNVDIDTINPFENQNRLLSSLLGAEKRSFFTQIPVTTTVEENFTTSMSGDHTRYARRTAGQESYIEYTLYAEGDHDVYMYLPTVYERKVSVSVNGSFIAEYYDSADYSILRLGEFFEGEELVVRLTLDKDKEDLYMQDQYFYYFDKAVFEEAMSELNESSSEVTRLSDTHLKASVNAQKDGLLYTSIPFEPGWTVKVDGERMEILEVAGGLMAVELSAGEHELDMTFLPKGLLPGAAVSAAGLAVFIVFFLRDRKRRKSLAAKYPAERW